MTKTEKIRKRHTGLTIATRKSITGRLFILPWAIGMIYFFLIPFIEGVFYTFNDMQFSASGVNPKFVGFANYAKAFADIDYIQALVSIMKGIIPQVAIIVFFSLFVAIILRTNFKGRTLARAIFFLPVIIASGVVIVILKESVMAGTTVSTAKEASYMFQAPKFDVILQNLGLPTKILTYFTLLVNQLFDLLWKSGVQILLLLAAVNNIPSSSYEVADIEGATEWEKFWKITFPMVTPTLLVAVIYTIIDSFTDYGNSIMRMVTQQLQKGHFEYSSTLAYIYFVCVLAVLAIVGFIISKHVYYVAD